jgi:hypothetical protein
MTHSADELLKQAIFFDELSHSTSKKTIKLADKKEIPEGIDAEIEATRNQIREKRLELDDLGTKLMGLLEDKKRMSSDKEQEFALRYAPMSDESPWAQFSSGASDDIDAMLKEAQEFFKKDS